jgi:hypothetical protein
MWMRRRGRNARHTNADGLRDTDADTNSYSVADRFANPDPYSCRGRYYA